LVLAPDLQAKLVPVRIGGSDQWSEAVCTIRDVGNQWVQHIAISDGCFWAGADDGAQILHHNKLSPASNA
jgi:hypothetical protein